MTSWREGLSGALQMGASDRAWCLGCCWLLCVIMFPLGMMNVAVLASVTVIVFVEKTLPWGAKMARAVGAVLFAYGLLAIILPAAPDDVLQLKIYAPLTCDGPQPCQR